MLEQYPWLLPALLIIASSVIGVLAILIIRRRAQQRRDDLQSEFFGHGFTPLPDEHGLLESELGQLRLFSRGHSKRVTSPARRQHSDDELYFFEYRYTTGGGKNSSTYRQSVLAIRLAEGSLPAFEMRPEHVFHKIGSTFGQQDIDFDDSPVFSSNYLLKGEDEDSVRRVFSPSVRSLIERDRKWSIEGAGPWLVLYRGGKRLKVPEFGGFIKECQALRAALSNGL